jgi:chorismate lyase/3-hydroxybenzoate synthase
MSCNEPVCVSFVSPAFPPDASSVLGAACFGNVPGAPAIAAPAVHLPSPLGDAAPVLELWTSNRPVQTIVANGIRCARNGAALFGVATRAAPEEASFQREIESLYHDVLAATRDAGYPHLLRMWNYFPGIHVEHEKLDRYQRFCIGRHRAFAAHGVQREQDFPAATVIGTAAGPITLYFIAAHTAGESFENPRQVSAYRYPAQYGPASPSFSRGMLKRWNGVAHFYASGTASIVGHATRHERHCDAQLHEVLRNLRALVAQAREHSRIDFELGRNALLKAYVRRPDDLPGVRATLQTELPDATAIYCPGDVCRRELLVEVEAMTWSRLRE